MRYAWLAAAASVAYIASGVLVHAQENTNQRPEERPRAERPEPRSPAAPEAEPREAPGATQMNQRKEAPAAAQMDQRKEAPSAAQMNQRKEAPGAAQMERKKDEPRAAQTEERPQERRGEPTKPATRTGAEDEQQGQGQRPRTGAAEQGERPRTGAAEERKPAQGTAGDRGQPKVIGNVQTSPEHADRVSEMLMRNGRSQNVNIDIDVGARVPESVTLYLVPAEVLAFAPEYESYTYFVDGNEIVFVAPDSHEIVGAIEYEDRPAAIGESTTVVGARPCPVND